MLTLRCEVLEGDTLVSSFVHVLSNDEDSMKFSLDSVTDFVDSAFTRLFEEGQRAL
jgi:hypothetical protein